MRDDSPMAAVDSPSFSVSERFIHFAEVDCRGNSALYAAVAHAVTTDEDALEVIAQAPVDKQHPTVVLAVVHDLALSGSAPAVAAAFAAGDTESAGPAVCHAIVEHHAAVLRMVTERQTQTNEVGRSALLYPAIARAALDAGAARVALVDVGCSAGLNLQLDKYSISYSDGVVVGDPQSPVHLTCDVVGEHVPPRPPALPHVTQRVGVDLRPVDVRDPAETRWLEACVWPDQPERRARLRAACALAITHPVRFVAGDVLDVLPGVLASVEQDVLPVVITTWAIAYLKPSDRFRFLHRLGAAALDRPIAWVSGEAVGLAPGVPTIGDAKTAAHSLLAVAVADGRRFSAETVARCHPHGRWIEWLAP